MIEHDECMHGLLLDTCSYCNGNATTRKSSEMGGSAHLETASSVERYRDRYTKERQDTFDAYVQVFFNGSPAAKSFPGGWPLFSRCANAEPARVREEPALVARAEKLMQDAGFSIDDSGRPRRGRRWVTAE